MALACTAGGNLRRILSLLTEVPFVSGAWREYGGRADVDAEEGPTSVMLWWCRW